LLPTVGAPAEPGSCEDWRATDRFGFNPKKSGPDQAVPVIFLAKADSERWCVSCQEKPSSSTSTS
jgi:hypothetical protein